MSRNDHYGVIDSEQVYTLTAFCRIVGYSSQKVARDKIVAMGCPVTKIGNQTYISGKYFQLFIEKNANSCPHDDEEDDE